MIGFWTRVFYFRKQPLPKKETSSFDFSEIFYVKWINFASNPCSNLYSSILSNINNVLHFHAVRTLLSLPSMVKKE